MLKPCNLCTGTSHAIHNFLNRNASARPSFSSPGRGSPSTARSETGRRPDHDPVPPRVPPLPTVHVLPNSRCDLVPVLTPPATAQRAQCCPTCTEVLFTGSLLFTGSPISHPTVVRNHRPRRHPRPRTLLAPWRRTPSTLRPLRSLSDLSAVLCGYNQVQTDGR